MSKQDNPVYQGRDWFSYRWTVAQAFGALDHIHDLCECYPATDMSATISDDLSPLPYLEDMCAILGSHLSLIYADTIPSSQTSDHFAHEWLCFEARQTFNYLCETTAEATSASDTDMQQIMTHALSLKEYLKKIDT